MTWAFITKLLAAMSIIVGTIGFSIGYIYGIRNEIAKQKAETTKQVSEVRKVEQAQIITVNKVASNHETVKLNNKIIADNLNSGFRGLRHGTGCLPAVPTVAAKPINSTERDRAIEGDADIDELVQQITELGLDHDNAIIQINSLIEIIENHRKVTELDYH